MARDDDLTPFARAGPEPGSTPMSMPKVLYIMGKGRIGSTLLNNVLGQLEGFFAIGELGHLWDRGLIQGKRCGCGLPVPDCPVWSVVGARALAGDHGILTPETVLAWQRRVLEWRGVPRMLRQTPRASYSWDALGGYIDATRRVYAALGEVTGARWVVESTKLPAAPVPLGLMAGVDGYVVHLVRDPRAVVHSWKRTRRWDPEDHEEMPRFGATYTTASWWMRNLLSEVVRRRRGPSTSLLVRYEDFVDDPKKTIASVLELIGEAIPDLSWLDEAELQLATHSVGGNPLRLDPRPLALQRDEAWRTEQPLRDRLVATVFATPFLQRYGYAGIGRRAK